MSQKKAGLVLQDCGLCLRGFRPRELYGPKDRDRDIKSAGRYVRPAVRWGAPVDHLDQALEGGVLVAVGGQICLLAYARNQLPEGSELPDVCPTQHSV